MRACGASDYISMCREFKMSLSTWSSLICGEQVNGTDAQHCQCYIRKALAALRMRTAHSDWVGLDLI